VSLPEVRRITAIAHLAEVMMTLSFQCRAAGLPPWLPYRAPGSLRENNISVNVLKSDVADAPVAEEAPPYVRVPRFYLLPGSFGAAACCDKIGTTT
jgi:hypothetical protein